MLNSALLSYVAAATAESVDTAAQNTAPAEPQYLTVPIQDLQVMHNRVMPHNPLRDEVIESLGEIDPADWRVVRL